MTANFSDFERVIVETRYSKENHGERFILSERKYNLQFSHFYQKRLLALKPRLKLQADNKWSNTIG